MDDPNLVDAFVSLFLEIWSVFTRWDIPFINISPAQLIGAFMMLNVVSFVLRSILGMTGGVSLAVGGTYKDLKRRNDVSRRAAESEARYQSRLAERRAYSERRERERRAYYESRRHRKR